MRTITTTAYQFSELSEGAKEKALEEWRCSDVEYFWGRDALNSLKKFIEHFGGTLSNYSIDFLEPHRNSYRIDLPEDLTKKEILSLLNKLGTYNKKTLKGHGDCKLTGYCMDEECIDGFRKAWFDGERDLLELINAGIHTWEQAVKADYEYQFTGEFFADHAEANGYEFTEEGQRI